MPLDEVVKVFVLILVPTGLGMLVRAKKASFAAAMDKPVRVASAIILAVLVLGILLGEKDRVGDYLADVGIVAALFCAISLVVGYVVPRALGVVEGQAIASSFEIGVHNGTLAIFVAENILEVNEIAVPAAVYSLLMFFMAAGWGMVISRRVAQPETSSAAT
jgi:BASS family bile acid:Na+ symporter